MGLACPLHLQASAHQGAQEGLGVPRPHLTLKPGSEQPLVAELWHCQQCRLHLPLTSPHSMLTFWNILGRRFSQTPESLPEQ